MEKLEFKACKELDFSDNYTAKKTLIAQNDGIKVCWDRHAFDASYPSLVQFCKLRGRMNSPEACLCEKNKGCSDYEEASHVVENIDTN